MLPWQWRRRNGVVVGGLALGAEFGLVPLGVIADARAPLADCIAGAVAIRDVGGAPMLRRVGERPGNGWQCYWHSVECH